jgi:hypothetical protein
MIVTQLPQCQHYHNVSVGLDALSLNAGVKLILLEISVLKCELYEHVMA